MPGVPEPRSPNCVGGPPDPASRGRALVRCASGRPGTAGAAAATKSLLDVVDADPRVSSVARCAGRFGDRLPFLVKVLAAEEPLSLQAHPSAEQAKEGFAARESPRDSGVVADPQLPRRQSQTRTGRGPADRSRCWPVSALSPRRRPAAGAGGARARSLHRTAGGTTRFARACGRCSPPGSPRRSPLSTCCSRGHRRGHRYIWSGGNGSSRPRPGPCWNWVRTIRATPACWPSCCSTGSRCVRARASSARRQPARLPARGRLSR